MKDISDIFKKAEKDNSGTLTVKEFQETIDDICERYPQVELYLKNKQKRSIVDFLKEAKGDAVKESREMNIEEFKLALSEVDSQMKNLPATTQVANQQVSYFANCFNRMEECEMNPEGPLGSGEQVAIDSIPSGTSIWDNLHLWEVRKQLHNFPVIGSPSDIVHSGHGILSTQANK